MKPRVLFLAQEIHPIPPVKGAAVEQWIAEVAARLGAYEPHVVSVPHPDRPDCEVQGGVHYHRIRIGHLYNRMFRKLTRLDPWSYTDRVLRHVRRIEPAIVHIHNAPRLVGPLAAGYAGAKLILHMHNEKSDPVGAHVDALAACSRYIRDWYQARRLDADRFVVLPNGVDTGRLSPALRARALTSARARYGIPPGRFIVMYVGRISPEKGPDLLAQAARLLDGSKFHFVFAGEWPRGDPAKSERGRFARGLRRELEGLPVTVVDVVRPEEMPQIYALGDLVVVPSRFEEPFSMVAIEAMASGVPVLALRKGGMAEYMVHGQNALLVDGGASAAQLADAIRHAAQDATQLAALADNACRMVGASYTWERVAAQTEALYDQVRQD
jgi:glycosyltransferase involved in cell wall biosynthesis